MDCFSLFQESQCAVGAIPPLAHAAAALAAAVVGATGNQTRFNHLGSNQQIQVTHETPETKPDLDWR